MDRLTEIQEEAYDLGYQACLRYKGLTWDEAKELQRYRRAEAEGRLIVLPCKVGDVVYYLIPCSCENIDGVYTECEFYGHGTDDRICECPEDKKCPYKYRIEKHVACEMNIFAIIKTLGKKCFLSREEAERALEGEEK